MENDRSGESPSLHEDVVTSLPQNLHHLGESEPLRDLLASLQALSELRSGELVDLQALRLGINVGRIAPLVSVLLANVHHVGVVDNLHGQLLRVLLAVVLSLKRPVEVFARQRALGTCHVSANDEVGGTEVLPDDHVLDGFTRTCHLHGVRKVRPAEGIASPLLVGVFLLEHLIRLDPCGPQDVAGLRWTNSRMDKDDGVLHILVGCDKQLKMSFVNRVAVLKSNHWPAFGQCCTHLSRRQETFTFIDGTEPGNKAMHLPSNIELAHLREQLRDGGVFG
mmetsp:Transcript_25740/g.38586  ORF Transcript_25740/g.38586 Transcript_25740/m.38586 type:complete len:279 (+) Transcript_25740:159-995(+)